MNLETINHMIKYHNKQIIEHKEKLEQLFVLRETEQEKNNGQIYFEEVL